APLLEMPVDAVRRDVERAVLEPFYEYVGIFERSVLDDGVGFDPVDAFAFFAPELVGLRDAFLVELLVFVLFEERAVLPLFRYLVGVDVLDLLHHRSPPPWASASVLAPLFLCSIVWPEALPGNGLSASG